MKSKRDIITDIDSIIAKNTEVTDDTHMDLVDEIADYVENLILFGVSRSNRKDTINNFIDITKMVIENTKVNDGKTYTDLDELPTVIEDMYDIIKK